MLSFNDLIINTDRLRAGNFSLRHEENWIELPLISWAIPFCSFPTVSSFLQPQRFAVDLDLGVLRRNPQLMRLV